MKPRTEYIGGSDIANILGFGFLTPYETYLLKKGEVEIPPSPQKDIGNVLEPAIRCLYQHSDLVQSADGWLYNDNEDEYGVEYVHPTHPYLVGHLDGYHPKDKIVLECKATRYQVNACPTAYQLQVAFYCILTDAKEGHIAILHQGTNFDVFVYKRNAKLEKLIMEKAIHFWEHHVQGNNPPLARTIEDIREKNQRIYGALEKTPFIADEKVQDKIMEYKLLKAEATLKRKEMEGVRIQLLNAFEKNEIIKSETGCLLATYKYNQRCSDGIDVAKLQIKFPKVWEEVRKTRVPGRRFVVK